MDNYNNSHPDRPKLGTSKPKLEQGTLIYIITLFIIIIIITTTIITIMIISIVIWFYMFAVFQEDIFLC